MNKLYLILFFLGLALQTTAQNKITGKVIAADHENIIYQIKVESASSTKAMTGSFYNPNFEIAADSIKEMKLTISCEGYETYQAQKTLQSPVTDLGEITLFKRSVQLGEVVVRAKRSQIEHNGADYTIRNIQGTHIGDAGNLVDMLKWTPGIIVRNDDDISVIGKGTPIIYINDRKITDKSELTALSSTDVNKIEIIKEPDARYKNGTNAVVKIYLKKQLKDFLGATVSNVFTIRRRYVENPSINLSGKSGIVSGNLSFNYRKSKNRSFDEYTTTITHNADNIFKNSSKGGFGADADSYTLFGGLNFALSTKSTLGIQYSGQFRDDNAYTAHDINIDNKGEATSKTEKSDETENNKFHSTSASYVWKRNENSVLTLIADYAYRNNEDTNDVLETNLSTNKTYPTATASSTDYKVYTFNGDYSFKIGKKDDERIGIEAEHVKNNTNTTINEIPQMLDRKNQWFAAYSTFHRWWGKFNVSLGLRYEYDYTDTKALENSENTSLKKKYSNLFPNARIAYKRKDGEIYSINYQRTISRPSFSELSPIVSYEDSLNYSTGNPLLKPSFTNKISLTANLSDLTLSASYHYMTDRVVSIYAHDEVNPNVLVSKPENINHSQSWNIGIDYSFSTEKFNSSTFGYLKGDYIKYEYLGKKTSYKNVYVSIGGNFSYSFYRDLELFSNIYYQSPWRDGTAKIGYSLDTNIGVSGRFFKKKLYVSITGQDLFAKSVTPWWTNNYNDTEYWRRNKYDTRGVRFLLRYTFNTIKSPFKSRSGNDDLLRRVD
jgi:hypothetical protein